MKKYVVNTPFNFSVRAHVVEFLLEEVSELEEFRDRLSQYARFIPEANR